MHKKLISAIEQIKQGGYKPSCIIMTHSFYNKIVSELEENDKNKELMIFMSLKIKGIDIFRSNDAKRNNITRAILVDKFFVIY